MWSKERIKEQISGITPKDIVIQDFAFFPGKIIINGYGYIARIGHLKTLEKQISIKSSWIIKYNIIPVSGSFEKDLIDPILSEIPRQEIDSINIDQNLKTIFITFQKSPTNLLHILSKLESKLKFKIKVNSKDSAKLLSLLELSDINNKNNFYNDRKDQNKGDTKDLKLKIETLLPSWIKTSKISFFDEKIEIQTKNDLSDLERINFLVLLLESQIGSKKIIITQEYNLTNQLDSLKEILSVYLKDFTIEPVNNSDEVIVFYNDFPLSVELETKIKIESFKKTKLILNKFVSNFEKNSKKICLELKENLVHKYPFLDYCFVYYSPKNKRFDILVPEDNSLIENLTLELFEKEITEWNFPFPFHVRFIEDDPVFYLEERIFIQSYKNSLQGIEFDKPVIKIFYKDINNLPYPIWEKIIFRLIRFEIYFVDSLTSEMKEIFDYKEYLHQLENSQISELLLKIIPNEFEINSIVFDELKNKFIVKYENLFKKERISSFLEKVSLRLSIEIEPIPTRNQDEIIYQIVSLLPDWLINPKIYFDDNGNLLLIIQNDYEDKEKIEKFVIEQSQQILVPISFKINLTVTRIKQIVGESLSEFIEISRLKIYPEKLSIYLEGILKIEQDEDILEEEFHRIELKTKFSIEPYIKRKLHLSTKQSVHDLLQSLLNSYQIVGFTEEHYKSAELIEEFNILKDGINRIDLRDLDCFSIDPVGTKAVDECISVQRIMHENKEDELLIGVHVVDINSFIPKDSILDKEARRRSFSVYLNHIKTTFPLFPENLIEKISLGEYKDRPAISLFIRSSLESNVEEFFIKKTIIRNKKQFTYSEVNEILFEQNGEFLTDLQLLVEITSQFKSNRILRGSINLDFMPDNIADQIISELMIMANRLVGFHLQALPGQKVFRNQHIQSYTYLLLQNNFAALGYKFDILNKNPLTDINRILQEAALKGESELIMAELRNHMSNAYYSHSCTGHEALGTKWYTQWTSPLRKYMDLVVHRLLDKEFVDDLQNLCQYSSAVERLLKIRIETTNSNNFFDKINSFVSEGKELTIKLLKITPRHIILSTNQDFHLFVANSTDIDLVNSEKGNFDEFLQLLHSDLLFKIKFINVTKDRKDVFVLFLPSIDEESNLKIGQIKAKVIFSYD